MDNQDASQPNINATPSANPFVPTTPAPTPTEPTAPAPTPVPVAPTPVDPSSEPPIAPVSPDNNKKRSTSFYIIAALFGVVAIAAIIIFVSVIMSNNKQPEPQPVKPVAPVEEPEEEKAMTAAEKEAAVKETLASLKAAAEKSSNNELVFQDIYDTYFPFYIPKNANTGMPLDKSFSIQYDSIDTEKLELIDAAVEAVRSQLDELGFDKYSDVKLFDGPQYINEENGVICSAVSAALPFNVTCGHISWITTEKMAFINSLAKAYYEKMDEYPSALSASKDRIEDSVFEPYQRIMANLPDAGALFYRSSPTSDWVFFTAGQAAPTCVEYSKDIGARRAFQGQNCINAAGDLETVTAG